MIPAPWRAVAEAGLLPPGWSPVGGQALPGDPCLRPRGPPVLPADLLQLSCEDSSGET